jgi:hypothetical protein
MSDVEAAEHAHHAGDEPTAPQAGRHHVLDGEKQDGGGQTRLEEWPHHVPVGQASPGAHAERHGLKSGHGHDDREQAPEPSIFGSRGVRKLR